MSKTNDKEIDYMVGQQIVRARSYEAACKLALVQEKANAEEIGATVQAARASVTQHTPGPWRVYYTQDDKIEVRFGKSNQPVAVVSKPLRSGSGTLDLDIREANAWLIALAPELLQERDALQAQRDELLVFVRKVNAHLSKHSGTVDVKTACKWSDESDAVIARATEGGAGQ